MIKLPRPTHHDLSDTELHHLLRVASASRKSENPDCPDCLLYITARPENYDKIDMSETAIIKIGFNKSVTVLRLMYEIYHGPIPEGRRVRHTCTNVRCINPEHLTVINPNDRTRLDKQRKTKTKEERVREIREKQRQLFDSLFSAEKTRPQQIRTPAEMAKLNTDKPKPANTKYDVSDDLAYLLHNTPKPKRDDDEN